ncbi:MAG: hypothetical protein IKR23_06335 [Lachnospiraceae bacterium]|nr:hypothetical protein [Lachnospiraceae bacterium]
MKAVVLEIRDGYAVVMVQGGGIERIRDNGYKPGQEIIMSRKMIQNSGAFRFIVAAAALVLVFFGAGVTYKRNIKENAYVTVDVNPSLEYAVNAKCKVLRVTALNEDAQAIADKLKDDGVKGEDLGTALENTKAELYRAGYLGEEKDNIMLVSVVSDDILVRKDLKMAAETIAAEEDVAVYVVESTMSERKEAKEQGVSAGRYEVSKKAEAESGTSEKKAQESSVKELVESTTLKQVTPEEAAKAVSAVSTDGVSPTDSPAASATPTMMAEATATPTNEPTKKPGKKATPTPSGNEIDNDGVTPTEGEGVTPAATPTPEGAKPTGGADPVATPTITATPTLKPTATPTPKPATGPTSTPTPKPTATPTPKPAEGPTTTPTPKPTATPTPKPATGPTSTPTPTPLPTVTPKPTPTDAPTPTEVPTPTEEEKAPTPTEAPVGASDNSVQN